MRQESTKSIVDLITQHIVSFQGTMEYSASLETLHFHTCLLATDEMM